MANGSNLPIDLGLLILRLALGAIMVVHGWPNLFELESFANTLAGLELPQPKLLAGLAVAGEVGGGASVILGVFPRIGALGIAAVMLVAIFKVHLQNGFELVFGPVELATVQNSWPKAGEAARIVPHGCEYNVALLAMALAVVLAGAGRIALLRPRQPAGD